MFVFAAAAESEITCISWRDDILTAAVAMILRLWAMYNRSTLILGAFLAFYTVEMILYLVIFVVLSAHMTGMSTRAYIMNANNSIPFVFPTTQWLLLKCSICRVARYSMVP